ncbi:MAG: hypothetical protein HY271_05990 [Deltaproteobacteria bacterium]|nr:hypothetical protein [Deltaproteobacteria bacterium]
MGAERRYRVRRARTPVAEELRAVDAVLARADTRVLQAGKRTTVGAVTSGGAELVLKRFHERTLARVLETIALGSGAARVWRGAARLGAAGFEAPEILAVLEHRRLGLPLWSCAIARHVSGPALDTLWRTRSGAARRRLTLAFADYLRRMHAAGIYAQDLRGANVLVPSEDPPRFVLVDLDRVRHYRRLSWRRRRKNLVQVKRSVGRGASLRDTIHFLRRYLGTAAPGVVRRAGAEILRFAAIKDAEYARRRTAAAAVRVRSG